MKMPIKNGTSRRGGATPGVGPDAFSSETAAAGNVFPHVRQRSDDAEAAFNDPEVRYKRPPKKGRWPKGKSGNPKGRKKGSKNKRTAIIELMESKLGRKIPDPKNLTRYEGMMLKGIQQALGGDMRSFGAVLAEYRRELEASGALTAAATTEEDQQAYQALCDKIRREIEDDVRDALRAEIEKELKK